MTHLAGGISVDCWPIADVVMSAVDQSLGRWFEERCHSGPVTAASQGCQLLEQQHHHVPCNLVSDIKILMYIILQLNYLEELLQYCLSAGIFKKREKKKSCGITFHNLVFHQMQ